MQSLIAENKRLKQVINNSQNELEEGRANGDRVKELREQILSFEATVFFA
jgi:hypothetical protein